MKSRLAFLFIFAIVLMSSSASAADVTISSNTDWSNEVHQIDGNLTIFSGSTLSLENVTLKINTSGYNTHKIYVDGTGILQLYNSSVSPLIEDADYNTAIVLRDNSSHTAKPTLTAINSDFSYMGDNSSLSTMGGAIFALNDRAYTEQCLIESCTFSHVVSGISQETASKFNVYNTTFNDVYGHQISSYSTSAVVLTYPLIANYQNITINGIDNEPWNVDAQPFYIKGTSYSDIDVHGLHVYNATGMSIGGHMFNVYVGGTANINVSDYYVYGNGVDLQLGIVLNNLIKGAHFDNIYLYNVLNGFGSGGEWINDSVIENVYITTEGTVIDANDKFTPVGDKYAWYNMTVNNITAVVNADGDGAVFRGQFGDSNFNDVSISGVANDAYFVLTDYTYYLNTTGCTFTDFSLIGACGNYGNGGYGVNSTTKSMAIVDGANNNVFADWEIITNTSGAIALMIGNNATDNKFINVNVTGGYFVEDGGEYDAYWYPALKAEANNGTAIENAIITVNATAHDGYGNEATTFYTDENGLLYDSENRSNYLTLKDGVSYNITATFNGTSNSTIVTLTSSDYVSDLSTAENNIIVLDIGEAPAEIPLAILSYTGDEEADYGYTEYYSVTGNKTITAGYLQVDGITVDTQTNNDTLFFEWTPSVDAGDYSVSMNVTDGSTWDNSTVLNVNVFKGTDGTIYSGRTWTYTWNSVTGIFDKVFENATRGDTVITGVEVMP